MMAFNKYKTLEKKHRKGYEAYPVAESEFGVWAAEQDWGDE